jgi:hypothetical protein
VDLSLEREGVLWKQGGIPADDGSVRKWLEDLGAYRASRFVPIGEARGLDSAVELRFETDAGIETVRIGGPTGKLRYARRGEEPVALELPGEIAAQIPTGPLIFRNRQVLSFVRFDARRLRIGDEEAVREGERWNVVKPVAVEADAEHVDRLLTTLSELRAERFVLAFPAGSERRIEVELAPDTSAKAAKGKRDGGAAQEHYTLLLGGDAPGGGCFARAGSDATAFVLGKATCEDLRAGLASRRLFDLDEARLDHLTVERPRARLALEKRGPSWYVGDAVYEQGKLDALLGSLRELRATRVLSYGAGKLPDRVRVTARAGDKALTLGLGREGGKAVARVFDRPVLYEIDEKALMRMREIMD